MDVAKLYISDVGSSKANVPAAVKAFAVMNVFHGIKGISSPIRSSVPIRRSFGKPLAQAAFLFPLETGAFVANYMAAASNRNATYKMNYAGLCEAVCFRGEARFGGFQSRLSDE